MALTRVEVYLKTMNDIAKCKSKIGAVKFKIDCLEDILQNPGKEFTEADIATLQKELDKLKKDFVYNPPSQMDFYFALLTALAKETNQDPKELIIDFLTSAIEKPGGYTPEDIEKMRKILAEYEMH